MALRYTPFQASGTSELPPNQTLTPGQYLQSENGRFRLTLQSDGNLVIKEGEAVVWIADNHQPYSLTLHPKKMREPLQFVISNNGFLYDPSRRRLWIAESTHSLDKSLWHNTYMTMQDDAGRWEPGHLRSAQRESALGPIRFCPRTHSKTQATMAPKITQRHGVLQMGLLTNLLTFID